MPDLYIIAGCNGAGKTTASFTILPEMLNCDEFINADEIARGISPLNPEKAAIESGKLMLKKIKLLIEKKEDFAFESTLSPRTFTNTINQAKKNGYKITLIYFWLNSVELAYKRVEMRVLEGGHNVPKQTIKRRYFMGLKNLFNMYIPICDYWMIFDNSQKNASMLIAEGLTNRKLSIKKNHIFELLKKLISDD